ncbi:uncharacterized protein LOC133739258 isoform X2 [Rosa rugosa]|uniref:uncharacterized protein LOC133739258 isoform X2 n=1 Tax=Rosa rugosa TaxID=74645 RepID=UPI002B40DEC8|nr:uncharacterized protein LOC133739258 isoform X2 [Rosa rugosa]
MGPGSGRKVINLEGSDGELDERTERRLRRRGLANGIYNPNLRRSTPKKSKKCNAQVENLMLDKDYEKYLSLIQRGWDLNEHSSDHGVNGDCENEHNDDGNGHCGGENNDIRSVDGDGNKHSVDDNNDARVVDGSGSKHSVGDTVNLKSVDHGGGGNGRCGVDDGDGDGGNAHFGDGNIHVNSLNHGVDDDDMDPQYKIFWDNLKEDGNSYVLEMVQEDGRVKQIRYHQGDGLPDELDLDAMHSQGKQKTKFKNRETMANLEDAPEKRFSVKKRNVKLEALEPVSDGTNVCSSKRPRLEVPNTPKSLGSSPQKEKTETRRNSRSVIKKRNLEDRPEKKNGLEKKSSMLKKNVKEADADPLSGRTNGRSHKQSGSKYLRFSEGGCNSEAESDSNLTDDSYQEFLSCTKDDGKVMVFTSRICGPLIYDSDEESSSDSDVIVLDRDPHEGYRTPIIDVDSRRSTESHSQFRQGIMQDLKRPYHLEEYTNLLEDWSRQRAATGHDKNLRNGNVKSYALPGEFGKSYQEMYKDLAGKIHAVTGDDRPRKLNLLRGFFYWLKNISQEGSFKPWNDKACLKVVPQTLNRRTS